MTYRPVYLGKNFLGLYLKSFLALNTITKSPPLKVHGRMLECLIQYVIRDLKMWWGGAQRIVGGNSKVCRG